MSVLVTGASGFIGRRLVSRLLAEKKRVRALLLPDEPNPFSGDVEVVRGDIADADAVRRAMAGVERVIHLAAVVTDWGPEELFERVTVGGTRNLLRAAHPGTHVVLVSSIVIYGEAIGRDVCGEDHPFGRALGPYGQSKQTQEVLAHDLARQYGLSLTVVRPGNVYGPGSKPWVHDVLGVLKKGLPVLVDRGQQNAGLCYVDNLVDGLMLAAYAPQGMGRTYNILDGSDVTWERYFSDLARLARTAPPKRMPSTVARWAASCYETWWRLRGRQDRPPATHEALNLVGSHHRIPIERAKQELGFVPRVGYEEGLKAISANLAAESSS